MQPSMPPPVEKEFQVCVIGGGMAGLCAAIAAARNGVKTVLVHDRAVLGGNASSEIRMQICGAHGAYNRESGLLEEIQLENCHRNPGRGSWSIWDSVLYEKARFQPGLTLLLNCSCTEAEMDGGRIATIGAWQLTTQIRYCIAAELFIDCSGDSILAPFTGAEQRWGRESRSEFGESIAPVNADRRTMGNSLLIQFRRTHQPQRFVPPRWAYRFEKPEDLEYRLNGVDGCNFWWIELGGINDTIADAEAIRDELYKVAYGVVDYIKNRSPEREKAANWSLEWLGSLPGKRENRRYCGDHVLTQHDVRDGGRFSDCVAYGGWTMDDHHPAGVFYPGKPTIFHPAPSPYGIPYRSLYSRNVENLMFAGRNISVTHAALSSTRVMGTCAVIGQAAGTAAALCIRHRCMPRALYPERVRELQATLMLDDCWLPGFVHQPGPLALSARLDGQGHELGALLDGWDRDEPKRSHAWVGTPESAIEYQWSEAQFISALRLVFDSSFRSSRWMTTHQPSHDEDGTPPTLVRRFRIEAQDAEGRWQTVARERDNYQRSCFAPLGLQTRALRFIPEETWGAAEARVFACEPLSSYEAKIPQVIPGAAFAEVRKRIAPEDMTPPDHGLEEGTQKRPGFAA